MKTLLVLATVACLAPAVTRACPGCDKDSPEHTHAKASTADTPQAMPPLAAGESRVVIPVAGMHCEHCVSRVKTALSKVEGVKSVDADLEGARAVVAFEKSKVEPSKLVETINGLGYKAGNPVQN